MTTELVTFRPCPERDPSGSRLAALLDLALALEKASGRRRLLTTLVAILAIPVWLLAIWPRAFPEVDRRLVLVGFGMLLAFTASAFAAEWRARRKLDRCMEEHPCLVDRSDVPGEAGHDGRRQ